MVSLAAFRHAAVLGGDRRLADPLLQSRDRFVVTLLDLRLHRAHIGALGSMAPPGGRSRADGAAQERTSI